MLYYQSGIKHFAKLYLKNYWLHVCSSCSRFFWMFPFYKFQRLPGFVHKDMEALFVEEQQAAINQLRANLESQPVTKGSSDSKIYSFNKIKGWVIVAQEYQHTESLSALLTRYRSLLITWTFEGNRKSSSYKEFRVNNQDKGRKGYQKITFNCDGGWHARQWTLGDFKDSKRYFFSFWKRDWQRKMTWALWNKFNFLDCSTLFFFVLLVMLLKHGPSYICIEGRIPGSNLKRSKNYF